MSMMENKNCPLEEKAILFAYGELSGDEAAETAVHIGSCPHCSSTVNALRRAEEVLSSEKKLPSEAVVKYILNCGEKEPERHTLLFRMREKMVAFSLAAVMAVAVFVIITGREMSPVQLETASIASEESSIFGSSFDDDMALLEEEFSSEIDIW